MLSYCPPSALIVCTVLISCTCILLNIPCEFKSMCSFFISSMCSCFLAVLSDFCLLCFGFEFCVLAFSTLLSVWTDFLVLTLMSTHSVGHVTVLTIKHHLGTNPSRSVSSPCYDNCFMFQNLEVVGSPIVIY